MSELMPAVTPAMIAAGVERLRELSKEDDAAYVVEAIFLAMEYERRTALGELSSFESQGS